MKLILRRKRLLVAAAVVFVLFGATLAIYRIVFIRLVRVATGAMLNTISASLIYWSSPIQSDAVGWERVMRRVQ